MLKHIKLHLSSPTVRQTISDTGLIVFYSIFRVSFSLKTNAFVLIVANCVRLVNVCARCIVANHMRDTNEMKNTILSLCIKIQSATYEIFKRIHENKKIVVVHLSNDSMRSRFYSILRIKVNVFRVAAYISGCCCTQSGMKGDSECILNKTQR